MISQNGCVEYYEKPLKLPNGETVLYKIEKINRSEGVEADVFENLLKEVEGEINWAILEKQNGRSLYPQYPHFYFDETLKDDENFRVMVSLFQMTPVEGKNIMLYPGRKTKKNKIHFLQVKHGDAFVIECHRGDNHGVIVVDGGPTGCGYVLQNKIQQTGIPDLMILTHYDDDHIGGVLQWINTCRDNGTIPAKSIWANCAGLVEVAEDKTTSAKQGAKLSVLLNEMANTGEMTWRDDICEGLDIDLPFATLEVISPTNEVRMMAIQKQEEEGKQLLKASPRNLQDLKTPLEELAKDIPGEPNLERANELANAASIAFILRCEDFSLLMLGDSYPQNVEKYLREVKGYSESNPLKVDYVKVSHHGSRNNTSNSLLDIIKCNNYLISTNGGKNRSNHPDRTAIAHILCHPNRNKEEKVHLIFNHKMDLIVTNGAPFLNEGEKEKWNFEVHEKITEL